MKRFLHILSLIVLTLCVSRAEAQLAPGQVVTNRLVDQNGDTLVMRRIPSEWRFGPLISGTVGLYFGNMVLPSNLQFPGHGYTILKSGGFGGGGFGIGGVVEYLPTGDNWGFSLMFNMIDTRFSSSVTNIPGLPQNSINPLDNTITTNTTLTYATIMPQARYNFTDVPGSFMLMGLDIELLTGRSVERLNTYYQTERIDVQRRSNFDPNSFRLGAHLGLGYDIFTGISNDWRMTVSPFALVHFGSQIYTRNGSNWNAVYGRAGIAVKFGEDMNQDTLVLRDTTIGEEAISLAYVKDEKMRVEMPDSKGMFIAMLIPTLPNEPNNLPDFTKTLGSDRVPAAAGGRSPADIIASNAPSTATNVRITANQQRVFSTYTSPFDTSINVQLRGYLDGVADYLLANPRAEVRITGHADNFGGTQVETQRVSDERALQVVRYLMRRGISRDRLLASGLGSRRPIQDNRTPKGRNANRRVEIMIVQ
jgi:outer membrane protein OmpA-like peptidoglycan-associated protein